MLTNGADIRFIQAILGHAQLTTTEIYTHVSIAKLKKCTRSPIRPSDPKRLARSSPEDPLTFAGCDALLGGGSCCAPTP